MNTTRTSILAAATAAAAAAMLVGAAGTAPAAVQATGSRAVVGHVYEATNASGNNAVAVFDRYRDGSLHPAGTVATGGAGAGASLHSQGGLARDGRILFVVNAGDDSVSALASTEHGLVLRDRISSGGDFPVSVTVRDGVGYVLNQGNDTINGFRYDASGHLRRLPDSTRHLTPNPAGGTTDAAQVSFTPDGRSLVVTARRRPTASRRSASSAAPPVTRDRTPQQARRRTGSTSTGAGGPSCRKLSRVRLVLPPTRGSAGDPRCSDVTGRSAPAPGSSPVMPGLRRQRCESVDLPRTASPPTARSRLRRSHPTARLTL